MEMIDESECSDERWAAMLEADARLKIAAPMLEEIGVDGFPDYGAYVTFDKDGEGTIHHSSMWKPKEKGDGDK